MRVAGGVAELPARPRRVPVPVSLAAAIAGRLDVLADDAVAVLRWAALLGAEFSVTDLEVVSGRSAGDLIGVVDAALSGGVVAEAGSRLRFRHGLIRQVLYERMPAGLRAALHLQAARALAARARRRSGSPLSLPPPSRPGTEVGPWVVDWLAAGGSGAHLPGAAVRLICSATCWRACPRRPAPGGS